MSLCDLLSNNEQDFRRCHALIQRIGSAPDHAFPPGASHHQVLAAKNVQRGLAAKVQELSGTFRKKQRVYLESEFGLPFIIRLTCHQHRADLVRSFIIDILRSTPSLPFIYRAARPCNQKSRLTHCIGCDIPERVGGSISCR